MKNFLLVLILVVTAAAQNVRTLAASPKDPSFILSGTADGKILASHDGGVSWKLLKAYSRKYVIDHIVFQNEIYVGFWTPWDLRTGYLVQSPDEGKTWLIELYDESLRAASGAPGNIVVGTSQFVYQLAGNPKLNFQEIGHFDNIDSVAVDGDAIYVGTYHLGYKTTDQGKHWQRMFRGIADDSDIFTILPHGPTVYVGACSGIYKSQDGGDTFVKLQGIPASAMRTRVLRGSGDTVYAGTTDGVWKTTDGGKHWARDSRAGLVVNDILLTADGFLLATDNGVILHVEKK